MNLYMCSPKGKPTHPGIYIVAETMEAAIEKYRTGVKVDFVPRGSEPENIYQVFENVIM